MPRISTLVAALAIGLVAGGCDLNTENPNAPDKARAFTSPEGLSQLVSGGLRNWVDTRGSYFIMALNAQADNYTASWNNAAIRFYASVGVECPVRCGWTNASTAPEAAGGPTVESSWYGYYTVLASANIVLAAINSGICFDDNCAVDNTRTSRARAISKMLQGMALAGIALIYDQGFILDETTTSTDPSSIPFSTRAQVRDMALQKFDEAWTEAGLKTWSTPADWMGLGAGTAYTNTQIQRVIRTMQAELIAMWPRNGVENAAADWARVATLASAGISSGTPFDWRYYVDINSRECGLDCIKVWGNSIGTMRVDTRVAALITTNHQNPWPEPGGNPCPTVSPDKRVGDGSYGPTDNFNGYGTKAATANAGTDFACSSVAIFPAARGQYHQSNLQHVRYQRFAYRGENLPGFDATGQDPMYTREMSDLLWAEGLLRQPTPDPTTAATLINNSRIGRGSAGCPTPGAGGCGFLPLTGAEGGPALLTALQYEQEIEFMGQGTDPYFNRRRVDGMLSGTPRQMPVPAKELDILARAVYTFGGPSFPDMVAGADGRGAAGRPTIMDRWNELQAMKPRPLFGTSARF
jgi:hypothetical protein